MEQLTRLQPLKNIVWSQVLMLVLIMIFATWSKGIGIAFSAVFGSCVAIVNTLLMVWHIHRAAETAKADAEKNLSRAYRCVAERWLNTIVMFATGIVLLELDITALMVGCAATQLMLFMGNTNRALNRHG
ncbi:MAG TPA: ATP synthase subunit I [Methylophaga aminisulfidivorans]|uniref:ATP synthase subunit I n=2 Tax=root TaxID=1 RepID=A0A7C1ZSG3_9GAMM|nr:ATP synthase subunit I [Methylophaga aminisulfidivorans]